MLNLKGNTMLYGPLMAIFTVAGYLPSALFYFQSGVSYKRDVVGKPSYA